MTVAADFESLWDTYYARIVRYLRRRVRPDDVDDLAQDVFLSAWDAITRDMGSREHEGGWMFRIAHNAMIDNYRSCTRDQRLFAVELDALFEDGDSALPSHVSEMIADDSLTPHELAEQAETVERVRKAIMRLHDEHQVVVVRRMEGYTFDEIGVELGKSAQACKGLQHRAYSTLRDHFATRQPIVLRSCVWNLSARIADALQQYGPMTASQLALRVGARQTSINKTIRTNPHLFAMMGIAPSAGRPVKCWGLRGIHDTQDKAA